MAAGPGFAPCSAVVPACASAPPDWPAAPASCVCGWPWGEVAWALCAAPTPSRASTRAPAPVTANIETMTTATSAIRLPVEPLRLRSSTSCLSLGWSAVPIGITVRREHGRLRGITVLAPKDGNHLSSCSSCRSSPAVGHRLRSKSASRCTAARVARVSEAVHHDHRGSGASIRPSPARALGMRSVSACEIRDGTASEPSPSIRCTSGCPMARDRSSPPLQTDQARVVARFVPS